MNTLKKLCCCCCCEQARSPEEETALYPSINPSEQFLSISTIVSFESSTESESSRCFSMCPSVGYDRSQYEHSFSSLREDDGARDIKQSPPLECFIIPSFGKHPPGNVAVKKMAGDFLVGVRDDYKVIQDLIEKDDHKQLYKVDFMCHFAQKKVEVFKTAIGDAMKSLKLKRSQKGRKYMHIHVVIGCTQIS